MSNFAVYVYADANSTQLKIGAQELNWTGTWSGSGSYHANTYDSVMYNDDRFIAVVDNVGVNPTKVFPNRQKNPFSQLVTYQAGSEPPFAPPPAPGTISFWASAASGAPATIHVAVVNGLVVSAGTA